MTGILEVDQFAEESLYAAQIASRYFEAASDAPT
jgi:hypothetical protein